MYDLLKDNHESFKRDQEEVNRDRNHGVNSGKYEWCPGCKEQVANCRCEEIKRRDELITAHARFGNALWRSEDITEARADLEALGVAVSEIEDTIKWVEAMKLQEEENRRTEWLREG